MGRHRNASWRWPLSEAWRDLRSDVGNPAIWSCVLIAVILLCGGADALAVRQMSDTAWAYREAGGDILTISAPKGIRGSDCAALTSIAGVEGAMAMRGADAVTPISLPDAPYMAYEVTSGAHEVLDIEGDDGFVISTKVGERLDLGAGDDLVTHAGDHIRVTGTFDWPNDGRLPQYASTIMLDTPVTELSTMFDSCWVRAWPMTSTVRDALNAVVSDAGIQAPGTSVPMPTTLNPLLPGDPPSSADYAGRVSRLVVIPAAVLAAGVGVAIVLQRKTELAMLRQFGASRPQVVLKMLGWTLGWSLPSALAALGALAAALAPDAQSVADAMAMVTDGPVRCAVIVLCGLSLGVMAASMLTTPSALPRLARMR